MPLRLQRISRRDLADVCASDTLHAVQMNEGRFATATAVGGDLKSAEIRHAMADMNRQTLVLHPAYIAGFFVKWRNVHRVSLFSKTNLVIVYPIRTNLELDGLIPGGHVPIGSTYTQNPQPSSNGAYPI